MELIKYIDEQVCYIWPDKFEMVDGKINMIEKILCAAIHYKNCKTYEFQPLNIESGIVVTGYRHGHCFYTLKQIFPMNKDFEIIQGFLTSKNRFVDRQEAFKIALHGKQIIDYEHTEDSDVTLISENLY